MSKKEFSYERQSLEDKNIQTRSQVIYAMYRMTLKFLIYTFCALSLVCILKAIVVGSFFIDSFNTTELYGIENRSIKWQLLFVFPLQGLFTEDISIDAKNGYINCQNCFKFVELIIVWVFFTVSIIRIERKIFVYNSTENTDLCHWTLKFKNISRDKMYDFTEKIKKYINKNQGENNICSIFSISHIFTLSDECKEWYQKNKENFDKMPKTFDSVFQMQNSIELVKKLVLKTKKERINRNSLRLIEKKGKTENLDVEICRKSFHIPVMDNKNKDAENAFQQLATIQVKKVAENEKNLNLDKNKKEEEALENSFNNYEDEMDLIYFPRNAQEQDQDLQATGSITLPFQKKAVSEGFIKENSEEYLIQTQESHKKNYAGETLITFDRVEDLIKIMRIFQANLQLEIFGDYQIDEDKYQKKVKITIAPYLDDIKWNYIDIKYRKFKCLNAILILGGILVCCINGFIEYHYTTISVGVSEDAGHNVFKLLWNWIINLLYLVCIQLLIAIIYGRLMSEILSKERTKTHSGLLEIKFIFGNFFLIANNIMTIFYGFVIRIEALKNEKDISEERKQFQNIFIGMQWVKNSQIIIMQPQVEKFLVDIIIKLLIMKKLLRFCQRKSAFVRRVTNYKPPSQKPEDTKNSQNLQNLKDKDILEIAPYNKTKLNIETTNQNTNVNISEAKQEINNPESTKYELKKNEPENNLRNRQEITASKANMIVESLSKLESSKKPPKKTCKQCLESDENDKFPHDFSLECAYIVQTLTFAGFYQCFSSVIQYLICLLGLCLQQLELDHMLDLFYKKSTTLNIRSQNLIQKYGFVFYSLGNIASAQNYSLVIGFFSGKKTDTTHDEVKFDQVVSFGFFSISVFVAIQMSFRKIIFRNIINMFEHTEMIMSQENYFPGSDGIKHFNYCVNNPYYYYYLWGKENDFKSIQNQD